MLLQLLNFSTAILTAYMIWKGISVLFNNESPVVVVLSESMSPAFERGDILFLFNNFKKISIGDICVFKIQGKPIPIVHRVLKIHEKLGKPLKILTKGDHNDVHDRGLYNRDQLWLSEKDIVGNIKGYKSVIFRYIPLLGMMTILMNDYPQLKAAVIAMLGFLAIINRE